jgi:hypothetical protein
MTRIRAFLIHLAISSAIFIVLLYLIVFVWYPQPFFAADGGWQGIRIIVAVDMVLGPILTLIVFKPGKKGLRFDLTMIGIVQTMALAWGITQVYEQRTAMVTYADGVFYSLVPEQVRFAGPGAEAVMTMAGESPAFAFVRLPSDPVERMKFKNRSIFSATPLYQHGDRYEPLGANNLPEIYASSLGVDHYTSRSNTNLARWQEFLERYGGTDIDYALVPLRCRYRQLVVVLRRADGGIVDSLKTF